MSVSVRADTVGGVEAIFGIAVDRERFEPVIEANDVGGTEVRGGAGRDPSINIRRRDRRIGVAMGTAFGRRKLALDVVPGVFHLAEDGGNDFTPCSQKA